MSPPASTFGKKMPMMFGFAQHRRQLLEAELARMLPELAPFGAARAYLVGDLALGTVGRAHA